MVCISRVSRLPEMRTICYANRHFATIQLSMKTRFMLCQKIVRYLFGIARGSDYVRYEDMAYPVDWNWRAIRSTHENILGSGLAFRASLKPPTVIVSAQVLWRSDVFRNRECRSCCNRRKRFCITPPARRGRLRRSRNGTLTSNRRSQGGHKPVKTTIRPPRRDDFLRLRSIT